HVSVRAESHFRGRKNATVQVARIDNVPVHVFHSPTSRINKKPSILYSEFIRSAARRFLWQSRAEYVDRSWIGESRFFSQQTISDNGGFAPGTARGSVQPFQSSELFYPKPESRVFGSHCDHQARHSRGKHRPHYHHADLLAAAAIRPLLGSPVRILF